MTQDELKRLLHYCPETGIFTWLAKPKRGLSYVGQEAGSVAGNGYKQIKISGKVYAQHRLAFLYVHGTEPAGDIDHINGDKTDNRIANLRDVSTTINGENRRAPKSNSATGVLGVSVDRRRGGYTAQIRVNGRNKYLGAFQTAEEANRVYIEAKRKYHPGNTL